MAEELMVEVYSVGWWESPEKVLWINLPRRRLQGFDHYWVAWPRYGVWNDDENMVLNSRGWYYEGVQYAAWEDRGDHEVELEDPTPPPHAIIWDGYTIPDEYALALGLGSIGV